MRITRLSSLIATATVLAAPLAAETCAEMGDTQFVAGMQFCVSSVLAPQSGNRYGPWSLLDGASATAWCEGVPGPGIGESITIRFPHPVVFRRLYVENGYGKSAKAYRENGRPSWVQITTSSGFDFPTPLSDFAQGQDVDLPGPSAIQWIRLTILETYPGTRYQDTCMNGVMPDLEYEEFLLQQSQ